MKLVSVSLHQAKARSGEGMSWTEVRGSSILKMFCLDRERGLFFFGEDKSKMKAEKERRRWRRRNEGGEDEEEKRRRRRIGSEGWGRTEKERKNRSCV